MRTSDSGARKWSLFRCRFCPLLSSQTLSAPFVTDFFASFRHASCPLHASPIRLSCSHAKSSRGCLTAPGRRRVVPGRTKSRGGEAPTGAGAERRTRDPPCDRACPAREGRRPMTRAGAPFGASPRRFFVRDRGFAPTSGRACRPGEPLSGGPAGSLHTDRSVRRAGPRGLPGARLTRPDPQAPHPAPPIASPVDALG